LKKKLLGPLALSAVLSARGLAAEPLSAGTPSSASASETLVLPGAANTVGTHATHWRSDLSLKNPGTDPIEVRVFFLRAGQPNDLGAAPHKDYFLISGEMKELRNVVGTELGVSGTGALVVSASRALFPNNPVGAAVSALMRTATPLLLAPGDAGSGIAPAEPTGAARQAIGSLSHDGVGDKGVRGAVGAVNLSHRDWLKLKIEYVDAEAEVLATKELHLPPLSTAQQTSPVRLAKGTARVARVEGPGPYIAYATTVDNATGAATFAYAVPEPGQPAAVRPVSFASLAD
jgi:hypothetical protein